MKLIDFCRLPMIMRHSEFMQPVIVLRFPTPVLEDNWFGGLYNQLVLFKQILVEFCNFLA